jgi:hypothetical protein
MSSRARDLVVVMAGDTSLHTTWSANREFDLWVIYYGDTVEIANSYRSDCERFVQAKGLKIELIRTVLIEKIYFEEKFDFRQYRYIFLPDDDIQFEGGAATIEGLFSAAESLKADIFQPAVKNDLVSFAATRVLDGAACHLVNWIENMMPGFRSDLFVSAYFGSIHALEYMKSGWGTELIAIKIAEAMLGRGVRAYVIDSHPAIHTRPVGQNSRVHEVGRDEGFLIPQLAHNQLRTLIGFRTVDAANRHMEEPKPLARNVMSIELYMQKVRYARKLWANLFER